MEERRTGGKRGRKQRTREIERKGEVGRGKARRNKGGAGGEKVRNYCALKQSVLDAISKTWRMK